MSIAEGYQLIHAMLVFEGCPRKWLREFIGDLEPEIANWRENALNKPAEEEEETDTLAI